MKSTFGLLLSFVLVVSLAAVGRQAGPVRMSESSIRRLATQKPMPAYPPDSVAKKSTGVAVVAVVSQPDSRVASVTVLEAPDDAIGAAVREAVAKWVIEPASILGRTERLGVTGKLTFYFQIAGGRGRVLNPEEMPGGPLPEPAAGPPARGPGPIPGTPPAAIAGAHDVQPDIEIDETELRRLVTAEKPTLLDIRERGDFTRSHRPGAVNIPRDELVARAGIELDRTRPVVIDCSQAETSQCRNVASSLIRTKRYPKVLIFLP
jgi:hypothetical protein